MFKILHDLAPVRLSNIFRNSCSAKSYHLSNADNKLALPLPKTEFVKKSFSYKRTAEGLKWERRCSRKIALFTVKYNEM